MAQAIPQLTRHDLEALAERLIDRLDEIDGDTDGDEGDAEDSFGFSAFVTEYHLKDGPGCPISDKAEVDDEDCCEAGDDGCGPIVRHGAVHWGARDEEAGALFPAYGIDQSAGVVGAGYEPKARRT